MDRIGDPLAEFGGNNLPGNAKGVLAPATLAFLSLTGDGILVRVDLFLGIAFHHEGDPFIEGIVMFTRGNLIRGS